MSQQNFLQEMTPGDRLAFLEDNASKIDAGKYSKPLTPAEIAECKDNLTDNSIKLGDWEDELKKVKKEYKLKMEPYQKENKQLLTEIRTRQRIVEGNVYNLPDYTEGVMESYNEAGEFLGSRKLLPTEKQGIVTAMKKAN